MSLLERNRGILARISGPGAIAGEIADIFRRGKREQLREGVDADGVPFAPLAPSTLRDRPPGPPLAPPASRVVEGYEVEASAEPGRLRVEGSWPGLPWVRYHMTGTRKMPRRDPGGYRAEDVAEALRRLREWVMRHG